MLHTTILMTYVTQRICYSAKGKRFTLRLWRLEVISQICTDCKLKKERYDNIQLKNNNIRVIHGTAGHLHICISLLHDHVAGFIPG